MSDYKLMRRIRDIALNNDERVELIKAIQLAQQRRWERLRNFHSQGVFAMKTRHFFMQREIELLREQKERLQQLMDDLNEYDDEE